MTPFIESIGGLLAAQWVGLAFAFASAGKLEDRAASVSAVERFELLQPRVARIVGSFLPWIELLLAVSLIVGLAARMSAIVAVALLAAFSIAQAVVLVQGRQVACGCFGSVSSATIQWRDLVRNGLLILCCIWSIRATNGFFELFRQPSNLAAIEVVAIQLMGTGIFLQFALVRSVLAIRRQEVEYQEDIEMRRKALAVQSFQPARFHDFMVQQS
jgi:hypothetical protein